MAKAKQSIDSMIETDVAIVGAGPVGIALARLLVAQKLSVTVIDNLSHHAWQNPQPDGRGIAISYGNRRIFESLGIWQKIKPADKAPITEIRVSDGNAPLFLHFDHADIGSEPLGHIIETHVIKQALFHDLPPQIQFIEQASPLAIESDLYGSTLILNQGSRIKAKLIVGADGKNSRIRTLAGIGVNGRDYNQIALVGSIGHELTHDGVAQERFLHDSILALLPMNGDRSSYVWIVPPERAQTYMNLNEDDFCYEIQRRFGDYLGTFHSPTQRFSYPLSLTHALNYIKPRLALIGDAAHAIHPLAGQGLNLGLQGAMHLNEAIREGQSLGIDIGSMNILESYERRQMLSATAMILATDGLHRLFTSNNGLVTLARDLGLGAVHRVKPLKNWLMRRAMGD